MTGRDGSRSVMQLWRPCRIPARPQPHERGHLQVGRQQRVPVALITASRSGAAGGGARFFISEAMKAVENAPGISGAVRWVDA